MSFIYTPSPLKHRIDLKELPTTKGYKTGLLDWTENIINNNAAVSFSAKYIQSKWPVVDDLKHGITKID